MSGRCRRRFSPWRCSAPSRTPTPPRQPTPTDLARARGRRRRARSGTSRPGPRLRPDRRRLGDDRPRRPRRHDLGRPGPSLRPEVDHQVVRRDRPRPGHRRTARSLSTTRPATHHPTLGVPPEENTETGWLDDITIRHLATQTAGFDKPGGYAPLLFPPGTRWHYSDGGPNWLAECVTLAYRRDVADLMFERVFTPLGITHDDLTLAEERLPPGARSTASPAASSAPASAPTSTRWPASATSTSVGGRWKRPSDPGPANSSTCARTTLPERRRPARRPARRVRRRLRPLRPALVEQRRRHAAGRPPRRVLVVGPVRQPDRRHPEPRPRRRPRRPVVGAEPRGPHYDVLKPFLGPIAAVGDDAPRSAERPRIRRAGRSSASTGRRPARSSAAPRARTTGR